MKKSFVTNGLLTDNIETIEYKTLLGRQVKISNKNTQSKIVFIYGHHASLERVAGILLALSDFGDVYCPDLPGFGGMDNLYKINQTPTIDNLAEYLADYLKKNFKNQKIVLVGLSLGFVIITRMLQNCPELTKKVTLLVSLVGFSSYLDFNFSKFRRTSYYLGAVVLDNRFFSILFDKIILSKWTLKLFYAHTYNARTKFLDMDQTEYNQKIDFEINLWKINHVRTWLHTARELLALDNTFKRINHKLIYVGSKHDNYFNQDNVLANLNQIFSSVDNYLIDLANHSPSILASKKEAATLIPDQLVKLLSELK